ncbi:leucyl aminopeptidase [Parafrigoribacterium soli]|uniref:leucyl aminopeptidase n=1 Tax=Parafrigoribacterium soli TaxID=3144663 RepID=UPI0032EF3156
MTVSELHLSPESPTTLATDALVLGVAQTDQGPRLLTDLAEFDGIRASLGAIGVTGSVDEVRRMAPVAGVSARSIAVVGLGRAPISADTLRYASGTAARQLRGLDSLLLALPASSDADVLAILEGAAIGAYEFTDYRVKSADSAKRSARDITVSSKSQDAAALVDRARIVASAVHSVRDLVSTPASDLYPESFAAAVQRLAANAPVDVTVFGHDELVAGGFGGILGVGQGSTRGPRLVKLSYHPAGATRHVALVGKGITFDTGGLSLKQPAGMVGMKYDMTGAATVMASLLAAARLNVGVRLTAWLCIAENMPSGSATRPSDVLHMHGGRTVEVLNTDAEGRLVMADGLDAASEEYPDAIIDVATLTGAARVALGTRYTAVMGDHDFVGQVVGAAESSGELFWPMPLPGELRALLNSDVADIANAKIGSTAGGMLLAGVFLQEFIGTKKDDPATRIPWAHLDIAGTADNGGAGYGFTGKGPTGVAVRTLLRLAEDISLA